MWEISLTKLLGGNVGPSGILSKPSAWAPSASPSRRIAAPQENSQENSQGRAFRWGLGIVTTGDADPSARWQEDHSFVSTIVLDTA